MASLVSGALYSYSAQPTAAHTTPLASNGEAAQCLDSSTPVTPGVELTTVCAQDESQVNSTLCEDSAEAIPPLSALEKVTNPSLSAAPSASSAPYWSLTSLYSWGVRTPANMSLPSSVIGANVAAHSDDTVPRDGTSGGIGAPTDSPSNATLHSEYSSGSLKDLLMLAHKVDALEDDVGTLQAERDQAEARIAIMRVHLDAMRTDKENAEKAQVSGICARPPRLSVCGYVSINLKSHIRNLLVIGGIRAYGICTGGAVCLLRQGLHCPAEEARRSVSLLRYGKGTVAA